MKRVLAIAVLFLVGSWTRADEASDLLAKAIQAQAKDPAAMKKLQTHICTGKGKGYYGKDLVDVALLSQRVWPEAFRYAIVFDFGTRKVENAAGFREDRGWAMAGGMTVDIAPDALAELRTDAYGFWTGLLLTTSESGVKLSTLPGINVDDHPTVGLKVSRRAWPDVSLYFDAKTTLLRKLMFRCNDGGVPKTREVIFDEHKEFEGLMLPTKMRIVLGGVDTLNYDKIDYSFPATLDKDIFTKPIPKK